MAQELLVNSIVLSPCKSSRLPFLLQPFCPLTHSATHTLIHMGPCRAGLFTTFWCSHILSCHQSFAFIVFSSVTRSSWLNLGHLSVQFSCSDVSNSLWPHGLCSMPGFSALHHLSELAQTHVHWVGDIIQPSHSLSSPSPLAFNLSQHQGLFQGVCSSYQGVKVLEFQLQHQSFQWIFRVDFLFRIDWFDLLVYKGLSRVFSNTTV